MKKNVLLMIADDWSPIAGCFGNTVIRTPNVDQFAKKSISFTHAYCSSPSCAASRATILTGLHSHAHGQYGHCHERHTFRITPKIPTLPYVLKERSITTGIIGKRHIFPPDQFPWTHEDSEKMTGDQICDSAAKFFKEIGNKPFYLHLGFPEPHRMGDGFGNSKLNYKPEEVIVPDFLPDLPEVREELVEYYTAVERLDSNFGRVLKALEESGHTQDTLVIIMSDHGMPFPGAKASSFDTGHHCPFLIHNPYGKRRNATNPAIINWTDILPTILDWFELPPIPTHGRSILKIMEDENPKGWDEIFLSHTFHEVNNYYPYRIIRNHQYKYVLNLFPELTLPFPSDLFESKTWSAIDKQSFPTMGKRRTHDVLHQPREKLYQIQNDPMESKNLIDDPQHQSLIKEFRKKMLEYRSKTKDLWQIVDTQRHLHQKKF